MKAVDAIAQDTGEIVAIGSRGINLPGRATKVGLELPQSLSFKEWESIGLTLKSVEGSILWWIGDWLRFGEKKYGEMYARALDATEMEYSTLAHAKWVAEQFPEFCRRRQNLGWSHHQEAAGTDNPDYWLDIAEQEDLSRNQLRQRIKEQKRLNRELVPANMPTMPERCRLILGDLAEAAIKSESVDCIITDPPYPEEFVDLYGVLARKSFEWLKPGGSLLAMAGHIHLPAVLSALQSSGMSYHWTVAYLTPGGQAVQIFPRHVNTFWKPVFWFVKGEYLGDWVGDVAKSEVNDNDKRFHDWGQSESGFADLITRFTRAGDTICDPFMGGGTTGAVALAMNRLFVGIEKDENVFQIAARRLGSDHANLVG